MQNCFSVALAIQALSMAHSCVLDHTDLQQVTKDRAFFLGK